MRFSGKSGKTTAMLVRRPSVQSQLHWRPVGLSTCTSKRPFKHPKLSAHEIALSVAVLDCKLYPVAEENKWLLLSLFLDREVVRKKKSTNQGQGKLKRLSPLSGA